MSVFRQAGDSMKRSIALAFNRYPCYRIHENGVEVKYFSFSETNELPFDRELYGDCQIFIGTWANPVEVDIESFEETYSEYKGSHAELTGDHIIPSQRYKTFMKQKVIESSFNTAAMATDKILYAVLGVGLLSFITLIVAIAGAAT